MNKREAGNAGESAVCEFLAKNGYEILERNYTVRGGELDIIAEKNGTIVFVEVKLRKEGAAVSGEEAVGPAKKKHLILAAEKYLQTLPEPRNARFDVACVEKKTQGGFRLKYYVSAFDASK